MNAAILEEQRKLLAAGFDPGPLDGIDGPRTNRARMAYAAAQAGVFIRQSDSASAKIFAEASKYLGIRETPGPKTNPVIAQMFALAPDWLNQDDSQTAWCGIFRGFVGHKTATGLPPEHYRAAAWLNWGQPVALKDARRGDTIIFTRPGGNHVAIVDSYDGGSTIRVLGGNQSDAVTVAGYPAGNIRGIRRA